MRVFVFLNYFLFQVIYQAFGEGTRPWYAFNLITHIALISFMCDMLGADINSYDKEKQILSYVKIVSIGHCIYLVYCVIINDYIRIHKDTDLYSIFYAIALVFFLLNLSKYK